MAAVTEANSSEKIILSTPFKRIREPGEQDDSLDSTKETPYSTPFVSKSWVELLEDGELTPSKDEDKDTAEDKDMQRSQFLEVQRPLEIQFLDSSNEAKLEKLLQDEKLISPFKIVASNSAEHKADIASIKNYDPSILDFKVATSSSSTVKSTGETIEPEINNFFKLAATSCGTSTQTYASVLGRDKEDTVKESKMMNSKETSNQEQQSLKRRYDESPVAICRKDLQAPSNDTGHLSKKAKTSGSSHSSPNMGKMRADSISSSGSSCESGNPMPFKVLYEKDPAVLDRRQKQIDFGKNTIGYDNYIQSVPKTERTREHPKTPPMHLKYSRRAWDGLVKKWRIQLHQWDPENKKIEDNEEDNQP